MRKKKLLWLFSALCFILSGSVQAQQTLLEEHFDQPGKTFPQIGRGTYQSSSGSVSTKDAYLCFGQDNWSDYEVQFQGRVPDSASQVQLCAGFRMANRDDRYILMLKGGNEKFLYLSRLGFMGTDDFLALRPLDFQPEPGRWYDFKIQVAGPRIRVFINKEKLPRIDIEDRFSKLAPAGKVTLGGSWIPNEFKDLIIRTISPAEIVNQPIAEYHIAGPDKAELRKRQRALYRPQTLTYTGTGRKESSLNGTWLFSPGYESEDETKATSPTYSDNTWHVMQVPNFWNPMRVWLHGERYNTAGKGVADNYFQKETDRCEAYTFDYRKTSVGWYRHWIILPETIKDKNVQLSFDAVSKVAEVWINGKKAGSHVGMFGDFSLDIGRHLKPGKNLIAVKVLRDYVKDIKDADKIAGVAVTVEVTQKMVKDLAHGFFNEDPAGIWQPVKLTITDPIRINDVFIKSHLDGASFDVTIQNHLKGIQTVALSTIITDTKTRNNLYHGADLPSIKLKPNEIKTITFDIRGLSPKLWSPEHPNLYDFSFNLQTAKNSQPLDTKTIRSGFRTFQADGDYLKLNGKPYWLRGGNHTAMPLAPNDTILADTFSRLMKRGNIDVTRTHTVPYTETWMNASDETGIGVSYEGTWPWLFLESSMPEQQLIDLWKTEFADLLRKYRNHPSLLFWTMNNEMKFYDNDPDLERAKTKMRIIADMVTRMRKIDPTRPIVFDSNYRRSTKRFGQAFMQTVDDGDIDDPHAYYNWYDYTIFKFFKGEWQQNFKNPNRPLISQEMSTGYTDETGHPTRYYTYVHQNPQALIGKYVYEYNDPKYFLTAQAFITKELAEALRRSNDKAAGILHFATITWFKNVYQADKIKPWPVYYEMKKALQPVLVTAELWGRHFYTGTKLPARICVVNDQEDGRPLANVQLKWKIIDSAKNIIKQGAVNIAAVDHYQRKWLEPDMQIPEIIGSDRVNGKLAIELWDNDKQISENSYDILLMTKTGVQSDKLKNMKIAILDPNSSLDRALSAVQVGHVKCNTVEQLLKTNASVHILAGLDSSQIPPKDVKLLQSFLSRGGKLLISGCGKLAQRVFPQSIRGLITDNSEVANMDIPESRIFDGIQPLDIRYFNNNIREIPSVISGAFQVIRNPRLELLSSFTKVHGYLPGNVEDRVQQIDKIRGFPIVSVTTGKGLALLSEMRLDKATTDPVAAKLLINLLNTLK